MNPSESEESDLSIPGNPDGTPPMVRLTGESGFVIYPKMVPDGKGGWIMADPDRVAQVLSARKTGNGSEQGGDEPSRKETP